MDSKNVVTAVHHKWNVDKDTKMKHYQNVEKCDNWKQ